MFTAEQKRQALSAVLQSDSFSGSPRLSDLIRYIVEKDIAGEALDVKAYTIGLDVLGKDASFDPSTDPIVRVTAKRMRDALTAFYDTDEGQAQPVRIEVPTGRYVPTYSVQEPNLPPVDEVGDVVFVSRSWMPWRIAAAAAMIAVAGTALWYFRDQASKQNMIRPPIVVVAPFSGPPEGPASVFVTGIRAQLLNDLAQSTTLIVSDEEEEITHRELDDRFPDSVHYILRGQTVFSADNIVVSLSGPDNSVLWSREVPFPENDSEFYQLMRTLVGGIAAEISGESGVVVTDMTDRLNDRTEAIGQPGTSEYACLLNAYAYDTTKDPQVGERARACLNRLVDGGSSNSSIWAEHALILFLDANIPDNGASAARRLDDALAAARRAVQLDPRNAVAHEHLGSILSARGEREEAIASYQRGLALSPFKPSLNFLLGWQICLQGDWGEGMVMIERALDMTQQAPGYMFVPVALNAFRQGDFAASLKEAQRIIDLGDARGHVLAFAASLALDDGPAAAGYLAQAATDPAFDPADPMGQVRITFSNPSVMADYERVIGEKSSILPR
ncbi:MAG: hypothetical protein AAFQ69_10615 [Pseudomonadota bacterium]